MRFFKISPILIPGEEGDGWVSRTRTTCLRCGLSVVPFSSRFLCDEDSVEAAALWLDTWPLPAFFRLGRLYFATGPTRAAVEARFPAAFEFRLAPVQWSEDTGAVAGPVEVHWCRVLGRVLTWPLYSEFGDPCSSCGVRGQRRPAQHPTVPNYRIMAGTWTGKGLYRAEEHGAPDFADETFKNFLTAELGVDTLAFKEVPVE